MLDRGAVRSNPSYRGVCEMFPLGVAIISVPRAKQIKDSLNEPLNLTLLMLLKILMSVF